jgi:hypothetical protein
MNQDAISALLAGLDAQSILSMFWFVLLFEGPRFVIANLAAGIAMMGRRPTAASSEPLAVSVIVPCHNGAAGIAKTAFCPTHSATESTRCAFCSPSGCGLASMNCCSGDRAVRASSRPKS